MTEKLRGRHDKLRGFARDCDEPSFFKLLQCCFEASGCSFKLCCEIVNGAAVSILQGDGIREPRDYVLGSALQGFECQLWLFLCHGKPMMSCPSFVQCTFVIVQGTIASMTRNPIALWPFHNVRISPLDASYVSVILGGFRRQCVAVLNGCPVHA